MSYPKTAFRLKWTAPKVSGQVDRRSVVNPHQARALLDAVRAQQPSGPRIVAFFAVMYYAGLRPEEAINLSGLFIKEGPVVQVRDYDGRIFQDNDPDSSVLYDGPLIVLTSRFSASASEILAGASSAYST